MNQYAKEVKDLFASLDTPEPQPLSVYPLDGDSLLLISHTPLDEETVRAARQRYGSRPPAPVRLATPPVSQETLPTTLE